MTVHFVGAGPGAPDLITLRAQRLLAECGVCLYAGSLVPAEVLAHCRPEARLVDFQARHPEPDSIRAALAALGVDLPVGLGELPSLTVVVHGPDGPVTL